MVPLVIFLAGMALPILMIAMALTYDASLLVWALYRRWHDAWAPALWRVTVGRRIALNRLARATR